MAEKNISGKIIQAVYTTDELSREPLCNKVIDDGLVIYEKCEDGKIKSKMGNGVDIWSDLEYLTEDSEIVIFDDGSYKDIKSLINMGSLPYESMYGSSLVVVNNELHLLGGNYYMEDLEGNETDEYLSNHYKYVNGKWIEDVTLPYNISYSHSVCFNNELHIFGGYAYDIETDEGIYYDYHYKLTNGEWVEVGTLPVANDNYKSLSIVYNDKIHYITSMYDDDNNRSDKHYVFDGVEWTELCNAPEEINEYICCGVIFGMLCLLSYNNDIMYGYDDANNCWREMFDVDTPYMSVGQLFNYNQDIYLFTGYDEFLYKLNTDYEFEFVEEIEGAYASVINNNMLTFIGCNVDYNDNNNNSYIHYNYRKHYLVKLENVKKNSIIKITNSFPISSNIQVIENGYKVIEDGDVKIAVHFNSNEMTDINKILNSKVEIDDDSGWSETTTYSAYKIEKLIDSTVKINDSSSSTNSVYSSDKVNSLLNDVNAEINVVVEEKLPIGIKNLNITSNNIDELIWCDEYPSLPYDFQNGCAVVLNDEIHILGGYNSSCYTSHYKFDGVSWKEVSTLPYDFYNGLAVVYNNEIHILGGNSKNHYKFNATNSTWISVSTLPYSMREGTVIIYNNEIHMLGGSYSSDSMTGHYKFDTATSTWVSVSTLPINLTDGCAVVYNDEIHILQGSSSTKYHYKFDTTTSTWVSVSTLPYYYFYDGCAVVYNDEIHILGSSRSSYYKYHYKFNGETWNVVANTTSSLPYSFYDGCAVVWKEHLFILGSGNSSYYNKCCSYGKTITDSSNYELSNIKLNNGVTINTKVIDDNDMSEKTTFSSKKINNMLPIAIFENNLKLKVNSINIDSNSLKYNWEQISTLPVSFEHGSAFVLNNELHYIGGTIYNSKRHFKFDNLISNWIELESSPINMYSGGKTIVYNNEIHVFGNNTSHYKFDTTTSTWISVSTLPYKFSNGNPIIYNNELHIIGTYSAEATQKEHYKFNNDTSEWTSVSTLPFSSGLAKVVVYNNEIHILGANPSGGSSSYYSHYKFNGEEWIQVSILPYGFNTSSAIVYNDKIHYMGGIGSNGTKHYTFDYENEWIEADEPLPYNFYNGDLIVYNNEIHILGSSEFNRSHYCLAIDLSDLSNAVIKSINLEDNKTIPIKQEPTVLYVDEDDRLYIDFELTTSITTSELFSLYTKGCLVYLSNYEKYFKPISFTPYGYLDIYTSEGIKSLYTSDAEF